MTNKMKVITENIKENELESLLIENISEFEEGMVFLANQLQTKGGFLDVLAVDNEGILSVFELKTVEEDTQIIQGLNYVDYINSKMAWISKVYGEGKKKFVINMDFLPRLILIAPSFSVKLKTTAKYLMPIIDLYRYTVIEMKGTKKIVYSYEDYGEIDEIPNIPTINGHIDHIENNEIKELLREIIKRFEDNSVQIQPRKTRISFLKDGKVIGKVYCRKSWFNIKSNIIQDDENELSIVSNEDMEKAWNVLFKPYL